MADAERDSPTGDFTLSAAAAKPRAKRKRNGLDRDFEQQIIAAYHELCADLPRVKIWNDQAHKWLGDRVREGVKRGVAADGLDYWRRVLAKVSSSDFLCGRKTDWRCPGLAWLVKPVNFTKLIEGAYDNTARRGARR
jgi:hypothetical protein